MRQTVQMHPHGPDPFAPPNVDDSGLPPRSLDDVKQTELSATRLAALTFRVVLRRPLLLIAVAVVPAVLVQLVSELVLDSFSEYSLQSSLYVSLLLDSTLGVFALIGTAKIVEDEVNGTPTVAGALFRTMFGRWVHVFFTNWIVGLLTAIGVLLLIVPGLMIAVYTWFVPYVVVLRSCQGMDAINYSVDLVRGRFWTVVGRLLLLLLLFLPLFVVLGAVSAFEEVLGSDRLTDVLFNLALLPVEVAWGLMFINLDYCDAERGGQQEAP